MAGMDKNNPTIRSPNSPLPQGWRWVRLGELFDVQQGVAMSPQRREGISPHSFLRTLNVLWGHIDLSMLDEMDFTDEEVTKLSLKRGDLLVCEGGEVGRTAIWRGELEGCLHQNHIHRLRRLNDNVVPDFYMYWMQAAFQVFGSYSGQESKTTIPNLSGSRLKSFTVPLLPVEEQRRIAAKIRELLWEVECARTTCEKRLEAAKALPSSYLRQVFESEEAKMWERKRLEKVCDISSGSSAPQDEKYFEKGKYPFVRVQDLGRYGRTTNLADIKDYINDSAIKEFNLVKAEKGAILFPKSGAAITTNNRAMLGIDAFIVSHLAALKPKEGIGDNYFIYYWLCLTDMVQYMENPGYPSLKLSTISKVSIPLPPLNIQQRIALELKDKMEQVEKLRSGIEKQLEAINALPQAILRKAFSGEL